MVPFAVIVCALVMIWMRSARYTAEERVLSDPKAPAEDKRAVLEARRRRNTVNALGCACSCSSGSGGSCFGA